MSVARLPFDGVVVLGKELRGDPDRGTRELRARAAAAAAAVRAGVPFVATLEARLRGQDRSGSALVAELLAELGVPPERVVQEDRSRSTREEARLAAEVFGRRQVRRCLVLTARYHAPRARRIFEDTGLHVAVHAPDALWRFATEQERGWIHAGEPDAAALRLEGRRERLWGTLAALLSPLPVAARASIEVTAGGYWRGVEEG